MNKRIRKKRIKLKYQWSKRILRRMRNSLAGQAYTYNLIDTGHSYSGFTCFEDLNAPLHRKE